MMTENSAAYNQDQEILKQMQAIYGPIFAAGPSQTGFATQETAALNTQVTQGTAQNYAQAAQTLGEKLAAQGGGNIVAPSGVNAAIQASLATSAANTEANQRLGIVQSNYEQGYQNWLQAAQGMGNVSGQLNPIGYSQAATTAGGAAASTANQIAAENNSWINAALGAVGQIGGGMLTGGMSNMGKGVGFFGQNAGAGAMSSASYEG